MRDYIGAFAQCVNGGGKVKATKMSHKTTLVMIEVVFAVHPVIHRLSAPKHHRAFHRVSWSHARKCWRQCWSTK